MGQEEKLFTRTETPETVNFPKKVLWLLPTKIGGEEEAEANFKKEVGLAYKNLTADEVENLALGFREIFINALYHGNLGVSRTQAETLDEAAGKSLEKEKSNKILKVELVMEKGKLTVAITDQGKGFNPKDIPDPTAAENLLKSSGRGLLTARGYYDQVEIANTGKGTRAVLVKNLEKK
ncbi:MAG: ATP-binding protein [Patescibacteria group bacterium]|nr:ATP-binding protein [Patescibacteria group bacterium]